MGPGKLGVLEFSVLRGDIVDVALSTRQDGIVRRNHVADKIFQFANALVVGHEPNADADFARPRSDENDTSRKEILWGIAVSPLKFLRNGLLAGGKVTIGIREDTECGASRHIGFAIDRLPKLRESHLRCNPKRHFETVACQEMFDHVHVVETFNKQHLGIRQI